MITTQEKPALDQKTIDTVKATVPVLAEHGEAITTRFINYCFKTILNLKTFLTKPISAKDVSLKHLRTQLCSCSVHRPVRGDCSSC